MRRVLLDSAVMTWHIPIIRRRMACASAIVFNWKQCSRPGTPCVLDVEPTAMMSLSYLQKNLIMDGFCNPRKEYVRDVNATGFTSACQSLHFEKSFRHAHINSFPGNEMSTQPSNDLPYWLHQ
jgi:hypothetical protein